MLAGPSKLILFVLDGGADRPVAELKGQTPLEFANTPNMDRISAEGVNGLMDVLEPGTPPGSDTAQMTFLGNDAYLCYRGRGALEAIGGGTKVKEGDVCFRANLATAERASCGGFIVKDNRAGRDIPEGDEIANLLNTFHPPFDDVQLEFIHTTQHRAALVLRGKDLTYDVNDTDPHGKDRLVLEIQTGRGKDSRKDRMKRIIESFQEFVFSMLDGHPINQARLKQGKPPVNMVLLRGGGIRPHLGQFPDKWGCKGAFICDNALVAGVGLLTGLDQLEHAPDTDYARKIEILEHALQENDFIYFHVKEVDNRSHDADPHGAAKAFEAFDETIGSWILKLDKTRYTIAITADHTTWSENGRHCGDPVPVVIWGRGIIPDDVTRFSERACAKGGLHRIKGKELLRILMNCIDKTEMFGS